MDSWVPTTLQLLLKRKHNECTVLMNRVRRLLTTSLPFHYISIYDVTNEYASLYMTDQSDTIYLYRDTSCSKIKPLYKKSTNYYSLHDKSQQSVSSSNINIHWTMEILAMDSQKRYESDKDLLEYSTKSTNEEYKNESISEIPQKMNPKPFVCLVSLEDNDDTISVYSNSSQTSSVKSQTSSVKSQTSSIKGHVNSIRPTINKPIPLHLRPKWKK